MSSRGLNTRFTNALSLHGPAELQVDSRHGPCFAATAGVKGGSSGFEALELTTHGYPWSFTGDESIPVVRNTVALPLDVNQHGCQRYGQLKTF